MRPVAGHPVKVLVCGWGKQTFMNDLIAELDDGHGKLPARSTVVFLNEHTKAQTLGRTAETYRIRNIAVEHIVGNPVLATHMSRVDVTQFSSAVVFCDFAWMDPDMDLSNGQEMDRASMLRLDAIILAVQLNIRRMLEEASRPDINIICEKVAYQGLTRFEDPRRLPMGITFNTNAYSAKLLAQAAVDPKLMEPVWEIGRSEELAVVDSSLLCREMEEVSYWELCLRARAVRQALVGYLEVPLEPDEPINLTINPRGHERRMARRVWNKGDGNVKLIVFWQKAERGAAGASRADGAPRDAAAPTAQVQGQAQVAK